MSSFDFGPAPRPKLTPERRGEQRLRVSKSAWVSVATGNSTRLCTVRNMSQNGARLAFEDPTGVPAVFAVRIEGDPQPRTARVRWRTPVAVGVQLVE